MAETIRSPVSSEEQERKERIKREKMLFIYGSGVMIEALKGNEFVTKELLRRGTDAERRHVLSVINDLKSWLVDFN